MGMTQDHVCVARGYKAHVSGERDAGEACETQTVVCLQFRELYDVVVAKWLPWKPGQPNVGPGSPWKVTPRCPKSASHVVKQWRRPGKCPRCGVAMKVDPNGQIVLWD
jgi:hypothetical protein